MLAANMRSFQQTCEASSGALATNAEGLSNAGVDMTDMARTLGLVQDELGAMRQGMSQQ